MEKFKETPQGMDGAILRVIVVILFGAFTVSRAKINLLSVAHVYTLLLYPDIPLLLVIFCLVACAFLLLGTSIRLRNVLTFWNVPLFLLWIFGSGAFLSVDYTFFAYCYFQWVLAYLAFILVPPLLHRYNLLEFSIDAFLAWSVFAGVIQFLWSVVHRGDILEGVQTIFAGNRAHVGLYFMTSLAVAAAAWSESRRRLHATAIAVSILCLLVSGSRAAQVGAILFLVLTMLFGKSKKLVLWVLPTIAGIAFLMKMIVKTRSADAFAVSSGVNIDASAGARIIIWIKSWEIITQSPAHFFLGIGFANFRFLFNRLVNAPFYANASHNLYLHYWTETGLVGLLLMISVPLSFWFFCLRYGRKDRSLRYLGYLALAVISTGFTQETLLPDQFLGNFIPLYLFLNGLFFYRARFRADAYDSGIPR